MSVQSAQNEVSSAVYAKLTANNAPETGLATIGVLGVYDLAGVPQNAAFPYVTIGDVIELPDNTLGKRYYDLMYTIHVWSRQRGTQEASAIVSRLNQLLDQKDLILANHTHISSMLDRTIYLKDPDGLTLHAAVRYRISTQEG